MESPDRNLKNLQRAVTVGQQRSGDQLDWAKFTLVKRTVYWVLVLLTVYTISAPILAALAVRAEAGRRTILIGALMTGGAGFLVRLLGNSLRLIFASHK